MIYHSILSFDLQFNLFKQSIKSSGKGNILNNSKNNSGLIWVTGFSSSGKTTISRDVNLLLKKNGHTTIFLDGDDLRKIFGDTWGYEKESRQELARVYLRLCSHLASQNHVVVISAIAMFSPLYEWVKENFENSLQVYLNVPANIRLDRDSKTKKIFKDNDLNDDFYDIPENPDLVIDNYGNQDPRSAAEKIVRQYFDNKKDNSNNASKEHWDNYYNKKQNAPQFPSPFAEYVETRIADKTRLLEVGCGNGRDSIYFASKGHLVTAIDRSASAIDFCKSLDINDNMNFLDGDLSEIRGLEENYFEIIYSRFVLHAMTLDEEIETLNICNKILVKGGTFFIECRSVNDPLYRKGEIISHTERVDGHYRRFIILDELCERLNESGFQVIERQESNGLAKFGSDDPVVIRIEAIKN